MTQEATSMFLIPTFKFENSIFPPSVATRLPLADGYAAFPKSPAFGHHGILLCPSSGNTNMAASCVFFWFLHYCGQYYLEWELATHGLETRLDPWNR